VSSSFVIFSSSPTFFIILLIFPKILFSYLSTNLLISLFDFSFIFSTFSSNFFSNSFISFSNLIESSEIDFSFNDLIVLINYF